jgi:hypothetical protein
MLLFVHALIDDRDLFHPVTPLAVFQIEKRFGRPMEVIGDEGYLLVQRLEGIA